MGFSVGTKQPKLLSPDAFLKLKICQKCFGPRTPLGELTALLSSPIPHSCDALLLRGGEGRDEAGREREGEGRKGGLPPASRGIIGPVLHISFCTLVAQQHYEIL